MRNFLLAAFVIPLFIGAAHSQEGFDFSSALAAASQRLVELEATGGSLSDEQQVEKMQLLEAFEILKKYAELGASAEPKESQVGKVSVTEEDGVILTSEVFAGDWVFEEGTNDGGTVSCKFITTSTFEVPFALQIDYFLDFKNMKEKDYKGPGYHVFIWDGAFEGVFAQGESINVDFVVGRNNSQLIMRYLGSFRAGDRYNFPFEKDVKDFYEQISTSGTMSVYYNGSVGPDFSLLPGRDVFPRMTECMDRVWKRFSDSF